MKTLDAIVLPADCYYTEEHVWIKATGDTYTVGISDFAQDQLGEIVYIELPSEGDTFKAAETFGEVESIKSVNKLFMPVDGEVVAINEALDDMPTLINASCYEKAWIIQIKVANADSINSLMNADAYRAFLQK